MNRILASAALSLALTAAPALAVDGVRHADAQLEHKKIVAAKAATTGDAATIAVSRADLKAAEAKAWAARHPAKAPAPVPEVAHR